MNPATDASKGTAAEPVEDWRLRLYVAGQTPKSLLAFTNLTRLCEERLQGRYTIEVIDLLKTPQLAEDER